MRKLEDLLIKSAELEFMKTVTVDTYTNSSPVMRVRMTHNPTGIISDGVGISRSKTMQECTDALIKKVVDQLPD